ncbi:MAG: hypothetical protein U5K51_11465 [Flavobacteriaceae bacterium]|nr:hypothetical protein [Flavobacteriaceae bacterium]
MCHVVLRMFDVDTKDETIDGEQLSFLLKNNILLTFQEKKGDVFDGIRTRIREDKGIIRKKAQIIYCMPCWIQLLTNIS